jgi:Family of unknown function (DUF6084)
MMSELSMSVLGASVEQYAATPQLKLRVRITESTGIRIYAIALRAQVQIEPQRRKYLPGESDRLIELFGTPARYGDTLKPLLWMHAAQTVLAFTDETEFDIPVPCSYDFEVAAHKYLAALEDGEIPINLLFSGTVFVQAEDSIANEFVPWNCEARFRLPVATWRAAMDAFFPNSAWLRLSRDAFDELYRYKVAQGLPTWDKVIARLCADASVKP